MPVNRNALIRYKTIDKCLQNKYRRWTLEDLIEACSDALYEYEGILKGISRRTVQLDLQMMRSDKLGYNAPIIVYENKYYTYEDPDYSITNIPLTNQDLNKLTETVDFLKQFKGFSHFRELDTMIQKLEDHVFSQKSKRKPAIDFEKNENLKGLEFLDILYQAIVNQKALRITYQSFRARKADSFDFHPYLLKEFRNRWFLIGVKKENVPLLNLALDRIIDVRKSDELFISKDDFDGDSYFEDVIGVTVNAGKPPDKVILFVTHKHAPYVLTKPLHKSQKLIKRDDWGIVISLYVQHNYELEKEILGFGDGMTVISPEKLKRSINERLQTTIDMYQSEISEKGLLLLQKKFNHLGFINIYQAYTKRALRQILFKINNQRKEYTENDFSAFNFSDTIAGMQDLVFNKSIHRIVEIIGCNSSNVSVTYHESIHEEYSDWQQIFKGTKKRVGIINLYSEKETIIKFLIIPGSHKREMNTDEINLICENSSPINVEIASGGALFLQSGLITKIYSDNPLKNHILLLMYFD